MKFRVPLYAQIFLMVFLYVTTLAVVVFVSLNAQFGFGWNAVIKSPLGERVNTLADAITGQLKSVPADRYNEILNSFGELHHVKFYIFSFRGTQLAGESITPPPELAERLTEFGPPFRNRADGKFGPGGFPWMPGDHLRFSERHHEHTGNTTAGDSFLNRGEPHDIEGQNIGGKSQSITQSKTAELSPEHDLRGPEDMPPPPVGMPPPPDGDMHPPGDIPSGGSPRPENPNFPHDGMRLPNFVPKELSHAHGQFLVHSRNPDRFWICSHILFYLPQSNHFVPSTIVALSDNIWQNNLVVDSSFILQSATVLLLLSLAFWSPFIFSISESLSKLTVATERIAEGHFDTRLNMKRRDEIGRLSDAVNTMAEKLTNFVTGQKRFLGDISHELFTPIARLQMALELLDEDASSGQTALIQDIREEVQEMTSLVNELLAFSKAGLKGTEPEITVLKPRSILLDLISKLDLNDNVVLNVDERYEVSADPLLLTRAFSNVLRNSMRYAGDKGKITINAQDLVDQVSITISDQGPGVPADALKRLAEPFFRPEASRTRSSGGVGLGLAIVKSCVESCNGTLLMRNRPQGGFEVEIRLNQA